MRILCGHDQTPRSDSQSHSTDNGPQIQEQLAGRAAERNCYALQSFISPQMVVKEIKYKGSGGQGVSQGWGSGETEGV